MSKATGASAVLGVRVDAPSDLYSLGHPTVDFTPISDIAAAPSAAIGGAGNLTGSFLFRVSYGTPDGALTTPGPYAQTDVTAPVGTPALDDMTTGAGSSYIGNGAPVYDIIIDATGTPDTFKWRKDGGAWTLGEGITGAEQALSGGVSVTFAATIGHTIGDAWTLTVTPTLTVATADEIDLTVIPTSGAANADRRVIERSADSGATWAISGTLYDNTTTIFTDNVAVLDMSKILPSVNQTGGNYGYIGLEVDSFDLEPVFSMLPVMALLGTAGKPRSIPGPIKISGAPKADMRPAEIMVPLIAGAGAPDTYAQVAGEPVWVATWAATTAKRNPRTVSFYAHQGSENVVPNFLYQNVCEELDIAFSGGKITDITPKFTGANYGTSAPSVPLTHTGAWTGAFVALGQRYDADALTESVFIKITDVLAANVVKFTVSVDTHASAGGGTYSTAKFNLTRNATSKKQTKAGLQYNDAIEITDQNGINLGADVGSNRQPFTILATLPFDTGDFLVGDIYEILPTASIPGVGSAPYSGVPMRFAQGPRFTDAHVTLIQDGAVVEATSGTLKFKWPKKEVNALGAGARTVQDLPNEGFSGVELTIVRYLDSDDNKNQIRTDGKTVARIELEGERIPINPGVLSTHREALYVDIPQFAYTSVKAPVTGQVLVVETIAGEGEQPDNTANDLYNIELVTRQGWNLPS